MRQQTLASQGSFDKFGRKGKRELFLDQMEQVVPWPELLALVEPHYPKAGKGRQPVGLAIMLRTYFLQQWFNLSDPGMEKAFDDSPALRRYAGADLGVAAAPDETTIRVHAGELRASGCLHRSRRAITGAGVSPPHLERILRQPGRPIRSPGCLTGSYSAGIWRSDDSRCDDRNDWRC